MTKRSRLRTPMYATLGIFLLSRVISCHAALADDQREYGEYLAGECTGCHRADAEDGAIPPISGLEPEKFIAALNEFRQGLRTNPAMVSVAKSLDDEQSAALAAYFFSLKADSGDK